MSDEKWDMKSAGYPSEAFYTVESHPVSETKYQESFEEDNARVVIGDCVVYYGSPENARITYRARVHNFLHLSGHPDYPQRFKRE